MFEPLKAALAFFGFISNDIIFLKIDEEILNDNQYINYKNANIYLLHYILGNKLEYYPGKIKAINENNGNIFHTCSTEEGSSGGPLLNSLNYKIIGVHKGSQISINLGTVIKKPIEEFILYLKKILKKFQLNFLYLKKELYLMKMNLEKKLKKKKKVFFYIQKLKNMQMK